MSDLWTSVGWVFMFAVGYAVRYFRPLWNARDWAAWHLGHGPQSAGRTILAMALLPDTWPDAVRARRQRRDFVMAYVPAPRGYSDFSTEGGER